jgi:hypothetical protein
VFRGRESKNRRSVEFDAVVGVPLGHVGEDDAVAGGEAVDDLDGVDGAAAELDLGADGVVGVGVELEDADVLFSWPKAGRPT